MPKRLIAESFIEKAKKKHSEYNYDYSEVVYVNSKTKVKIKCPIHGIFEQRPDNHLNGSICPLCAKEQKYNSVIYKHTTESFIEKAKQVHGDKYDYSKVQYIDSSHKICIICSEHGEFWQLPHNHLKGCGCPKCSNNYNFTNDEYIEMLKHKEYDETIGFEKINYKNNLTPVIFTCSKHGDFSYLPSSIKDRIECPECQKERLHHLFINDSNDMINKFKKVHNNFYSYEKTIYNGATNKIIITCPIHGDFEQLPYGHLVGQGCPKCSKQKYWGNRKDKITTDAIVKRFINVHNNYYNYDKVNYVNGNTKVIITCPIHGDFEQTPFSHLCGRGCPQCASEKTFSKCEREVANFINSLGFTCILNNRKLIQSSELDIYIPEKNIAIEYNGLYWHSESKCKGNPVTYHLEKTEKCQEKGIRLIHIFEDEWLEKKEIVKSRLKSILGINKCKIYARKCEIRSVDSKTAKDFLNKNHLQGNVNAKYAFGLYYNEELVSIMTFGCLRRNLNAKNIEGYFELLRFCNKLNTTVVGGASKLLKYFIKEVHPKSIISYADKRWSDGNLYKKLGFKYVHDSKPNYFYVINNHRENRFKYRKSELVKKYNCSEKMSEHEFCNIQGWYRIYDCETMKFEMRLDD